MLWVGLPRLRNLVDVYMSSSNRNDSVYTELPDLIFFIRQISKIAIFFLKKALLKNVLVRKLEIVWLGIVIELIFKLFESDCNMCRLVHYRHYLQLQVCN